jgi:hypothetical protein
MSEVEGYSLSLLPHDALHSQVPKKAADAKSGVPSVRRCRLCEQTGHNATTCTQVCSGCNGRGHNVKACPSRVNNLGTESTRVKKLSSNHIFVSILIGYYFNHEFVTYRPCGAVNHP